MTFRNLARVGATGLLAAGSLAFAAVPAFAADVVDFGVSIRGTTIAAGASGKAGFITVTNEGTTTPKAVEVVFDGTGLDWDKVTVAGVDECEVVDKVADCVLTPVPIPGESAKLAIPLEKKVSEPGPAGEIKVTVKVDGDTNPANDSLTVPVTVAGNGVDLAVVTPDVYSVDSDTKPEPVPPGGQGLLVGFIANQGDAVAEGVKIAFSVPRDATITQAMDGCTVAPDGHSAACTQDISLIPLDKDDTEDLHQSTTAAFALVTVSKDAKGPVALKGGEMTVAAVNTEVASDATIKSLARRGAASLPQGFRHLTADEAKTVEVDATDNIDTFAVLVAGPQGGSGGGTGNEGNGGGGLPVTGPVAASVAGVGGAVIVVGAVLFFVARRRRVVVVTPSDDK